MEIQSLSVVVPGGCPNECKFCVSKMHTEPYNNQIENNRRFTDLYRNDYKKRLQFARDNGCNTVVLTGAGEPLTNLRFLENFSEWNRSLKDPFYWIELQTSGYSLDDEKLRFLRNSVEITTISLSLADFDCKKNAEIVCFPKGIAIDIDFLCKEIKRYDYNLRISLNMHKGLFPKEDQTKTILGSIFAKANALGVNQLTFRKLYPGHGADEKNEWIRQNSVSEKTWHIISDYMIAYGRPLEMLPYGAMRYSLKDMSIVLDSDCMSKELKNVIRYLILRPDCKLYTKWDDKGSLLF